jgi:hypothetical protein
LTIVVAVSVSQLANRAAMANRANAALAAHRAGRSGYPLTAVAALAASQLSRRAALANAVAQANLAQVNLTATATNGLAQGPSISATQGAAAAISAIPSVPVVSASPVVTTAGHNALTSNPLAASLAAVAAQTQQQQQSNNSNVTLQGLSQSVYNPYDPFLATSLAQLQAAAVANAASNHGGSPAMTDPRLQNLAAAGLAGIRNAHSGAFGGIHAAQPGQAGHLPVNTAGLSLQAAAVANQTAAYAGALPAA